MTNQEIKKMAKDYWLPGKRNNDPSFDEVGFARALLSRAIPEGHVVVPGWEEKDDMDISMIAHNCDPGDWMDLHYREGWHKGFVDGYSEAQIDFKKMIAAAAPANKEGT